jgi:hypothetical protein
MDSMEGGEPFLLGEERRLEVKARALGSGRRWQPW